MPPGPNGGFCVLRSMQRSLLIPLVACLFSPLVAAQADPDSVPMEFRGTHPPDSAVLALLDAESRIMEEHRDVAVRDSLRRPLLSDGYFYHGIDGAPIDLAGLTARQTRNGFKLIRAKVLREVLYQYENSAILVLHEESTVEDKGVVRTRARSTLLVMAKENERWVFLADIIGQDPAR